jgi:hypothetical protein
MLLLDAGVVVTVESRRLGHANVTITTDRCTHVMPSLQQDAGERLSALIDGIRDPAASEGGLGARRHWSAVDLTVVRSRPEVVASGELRSVGLTMGNHQAHVAFSSRGSRTASRHYKT